jgi:hypothetical protein
MANKLNRNPKSIEPLAKVSEKYREEIFSAGT